MPEAEQRGGAVVPCQGKELPQQPGLPGACLAGDQNRAGSSVPRVRQRPDELSDLRLPPDELWADQGPGHVPEYQPGTSVVGNDFPRLYLPGRLEGVGSRLEDLLVRVPLVLAAGQVERVAVVGVGDEASVQHVGVVAEGELPVGGVPAVVLDRLDADPLVVRQLLGRGLLLLLPGLLGVLLGLRGLVDAQEAGAVRGLDVDRGRARLAGLPSPRERRPRSRSGPRRAGSRPVRRCRRAPSSTRSAAARSSSCSEPALSWTSRTACCPPPAPGRRRR